MKRRCWPRLFFPHLCLSLAFAVVSLGAFAEPGAQSQTEEYRVKAAFLFHFAQFVDWPDGTFQNADAPLIFCTIGEDPFHGALEANLLGKKINGHQIQVRHATRIAELQGCHVLFIGKGQTKMSPDALAGVKGRPVLTVGETEHFAQDGGMIGLCLDQNRIRFEINVDSAERARLRISAKLLALAKAVIGGSRGN